MFRFNATQMNGWSALSARMKRKSICARLATISVYVLAVKIKAFENVLCVEQTWRALRKCSFNFSHPHAVVMNKACLEGDVSREFLCANDRRRGVVTKGATVCSVVPRALQTTHSASWSG